jgi:hypothetical protein
MSSRRKLRGGVIAAEDRHHQGVIELLSYRLRERLQLIYYTHPHDIVLEDTLDFFVVQSPEDLVEVVKFFHCKRLPIPPILHINDPHTLQNFDHELLFPNVNIIYIPQARLSSNADITLQAGIFTTIMKQLEAVVH